MKNISIETLGFVTDDVPTEYTWSGYTNFANEYVGYNFLTVESSVGKIYICSAENGVALGDYLSNYILKQDCVFELENILSPGYDYWFFQAWEKCDRYLDDLDNWIHRIIDMLVREGLMVRFSRSDSEFIAFSELRRFETEQIPESLATETEQICKEAVLEHLLEQWNDYGEDVSELSIEDGGEWSQALLEAFIKEHSATGAVSKA